MGKIEFLIKDCTNSIKKWEKNIEKSKEIKKETRSRMFVFFVLIATVNENFVEILEKQGVRQLSACWPKRKSQFICKTIFDLEFN
jgi:hypothetical protein